MAARFTYFTDSPVSCFILSFFSLHYIYIYVYIFTHTHTHTHTCCYCCLVAKSCPTLWPHGLQHVKLPCPSLSPGVCLNSCLLSRWCYLTISSSAAPFSFCLWSFPTSKSFPMSWLFPSGGQSTGASTSASVLPMNIQGWFPLGLNGLISLQPNRLSRVFSSTTIWKHQFFSVQPSLWSNYHICTWPLEKP